MPIVRTILDFLELRPVFRLRAVQVFWWLYVAQTLYRTHWSWTRLITAHGPASNAFNWLEFVYTPLRILVTLATVRLLLEVLLRYLMPASQPAPRDTTLGQELLAFLDLRPFFTRWWTQVFWWLYLLTFLRSVYPYFAFMSPWAYGSSFADWFNFVNGLLYHLIWLVGVRLLVEAALFAPRPTLTNTEQT